MCIVFTSGNPNHYFSFLHIHTLTFTMPACVHTTYASFSAALADATLDDLAALHPSSTAHHLADAIFIAGAAQSAASASFAPNSVDAALLAGRTAANRILEDIARHSLDVAVNA